MKSLKTDLKKVKGLGTAKAGTSHWWMERLTSIMLVPLSLWFAILIIRICNAESTKLYEILKSPANIILMIIFITVGLYHGLLGIKVVIEDYVHHEGYKFFMIIVSQIIIYATIIASISALLAYHFATLS